jgi:enoyl-CoA hydratase
VGDWSETHKVFDTPEVAQFAALSEDINPIHLDTGAALLNFCSSHLTFLSCRQVAVVLTSLLHPAYAEKTRFGARIVHGMLSASLFSGILGSQIPGTRAYAVLHVVLLLSSSTSSGTMIIL